MKSSHNAFLIRLTAAALTLALGCGAEDPASAIDSNESAKPASTAPSGYPHLVWAGTPQSSDESFAAFTERAGITQRWGEDPGSASYDLENIGGKRAIKVVASKGTHGANAGFVVNALDRGGVNGGPNRAWVRAKVYWAPGYDYNPHYQAADGSWTIRTGAGGCKYAGPWGGGIPATANNVNHDGWALTIWTGSTNYLAIGMDLNSPRNSDGYAETAIYFPDPNNLNDVFRIDHNQGRWVQLEWEVSIESSAGGYGSYQFFVDGVRGVNESVRYEPAASWDSAVGVKGIYLRNWWGGGGSAPATTPIYYSDLEIWSK